MVDGAGKMDEPPVLAPVREPHRVERGGVKEPGREHDAQPSASCRAMAAISASGSRGGTA